MKTIEIAGELRVGTGKKVAKQIRKDEKVPCVMYGRGEVTHFNITEKNAAALLNTPDIYIIHFDIDGKKTKAIIQDAQFHPVSDATLHMDFLEVSEDSPVTIGIPVTLEGFSEGVKAGGKLQQVQRKLKIRGLIANLPSELKVDVTNLGLGKVIKVGELSFENIEILSPASSVVAAVKLTRAARGALAAAASGSKK